MKEEMQTQKVGLLDEMEQMKKRLEGEMFVMMQLTMKKSQSGFAREKALTNSQEG